MDGPPSQGMATGVSNMDILISSMSAILSRRLTIGATINSQFPVMYLTPQVFT